jgi:hypothetical protein
MQLVNRLSTVLLDRLPDFWRIAKGHIEGKYSRVCNNSESGKESHILIVEPLSTKRIVVDPSIRQE